MRRSVVIVGATGFVGRVAARELCERGWEVIGASRDPGTAARTHPHLPWVGTDSEELDQAVAGAGHVVNLAGAHPFAKRWSARYKGEIRTSRVATTSRIAAALAQTAVERPVLINASGVWYHAASGGTGDAVHEETPAGSGFLAGMITEWESAARSAEPAARVVLLRIGIGVGPAGGLLSEIEPTFRRGMGGPVGSGRQYVPWVSLADIVGVIAAALEDDRYAGPLVVTAPQPVTMSAFARAVGAALGRPARLRTPGALMRLAKGEVAGLMTQSYRAEPRRLVDLGYRFRHLRLDDALATAYQPESVT